MCQKMLALLLIATVACNGIWAKPRGYGAPAYNAGASYGSQLIPIAIQQGYGANVAPAQPSLLYAAPSNPSASASSAASNSGLAAGNYKQWAVPSYELLGGEIVNPAGGYANIAPISGRAY